ILAFTYAEPYQAARRAFARAADRDGRTVPATALAHAHFQAPQAFLKLYSRYGRDPNVTFWVVQNTGLEADIAIRDIDYLRQVVNNRIQGEPGRRDVQQQINKGIEDEYRERAATGRLPEPYIYRGFTGREPPRLRPQGRGRNGQGPQGNSEGGTGEAGSPRAPPDSQANRRLGNNPNVPAHPTAPSP